MDSRKDLAFAARLIGRVAWRLAGKTGITVDELPDIQQDIWLDLWERLPNYRPDLGHRRAFISRVVRNKVADILEARAAAKRGGGNPDLSLNREFEDEDGDPVEFHESISLDDYLRRTRGTIRSEKERQDLALDVRGMVEGLPAPQRAICMLLIDRNACDVANVVGLPRSTLRDLIKQLRRVCKQGELEKYFG